MFSKLSKTLTALISSLFILAGSASAQWGMPDFTNFDFRTYMQQEYDTTTSMIQQQMQTILQQRGPEIWAAYQRCMYSGYYCGSFEDYALNYVSTNGFTDGGAWARTQSHMRQKEQDLWWGVQDAERQRAESLNTWNSNYRHNQGELGNHLGSGSTWVNPYTGMNHTLPYTNVQPGQGWYDSSSGYYFLYNPYNQQNGQYYISRDGNSWQPMNPWQAPR